MCLQSHKIECADKDLFCNNTKDRQETQTDRQTDRQTHTHTHTTAHPSSLVLEVVLAAPRSFPHHSAAACPPVGTTPYSDTHTKGH